HAFYEYSLFFPFLLQLKLSHTNWRKRSYNQELFLLALNSLLLILWMRWFYCLFCFFVLFHVIFLDLPLHFLHVFYVHSLSSSYYSLHLQFHTNFCYIFYKLTLSLFYIALRFQTLWMDWNEY